MAPNVTGVYGCRKVVVPISEIGLPRTSESAPIPLTAPVRPWSVPMPSVV